MSSLEADALRAEALKGDVPACIKYVQYSLLKKLKKTVLLNNETERKQAFEEILQNTKITVLANG